ncbi:MAG: hypothetical protein K0Q72_4763, partial [Armatimonadetes bacterium]|nr:hypothetical protein [Armatimonadota bacterium]
LEALRRLLDGAEATRPRGVEERLAPVG